MKSMEENKDSNIYTLSETLSDTFNQSQWRIISSQSSQKFLAKQQIILFKLLEQKNLFDKYFQHFYTNHVRLLNWSILSKQNRNQINKYIFKSLVNKGSNFFYKQIKQIFQKKKKIKYDQMNNRHHNNQNKDVVDDKEVKDMEDQVYKYFYDMIISKNDKQFAIRNGIRRKQPEQMDGHQFYIRTFNACNGWKYIFYNYEKHMKGLQQKCKYNDQIRRNQGRNSFEHASKSHLGLLDFEHPEPPKSQPRIFNMNSILNNSKINNMNAFKKIAKDSLKDKISFKNHQGKPITYRACRV